LTIIDYHEAATSLFNPRNISVTILVAANLFTFAIGDVHGCLEALLRLIAHCEHFSGAQDAQFLFIGDYIDRGPQSKDVVDILMTRQASTARPFVCLRGNHEDMLLRAADTHRSDRDLMMWWGNGGERTLESYGVDDPSDLPADSWMRSLPLQTSDQHRLFVHAGIRPGIALSSQLKEDLLWIREPFLSSEEDHGPLVVHGHTPTRNREPDLRLNRLNIDTGACFGGPLTAAVFSDAVVTPLFFIKDTGEIISPGEL
jgi:serine/threonine protein phosphatase 1